MSANHWSDDLTGEGVIKISLGQKEARAFKVRLEPFCGDSESETFRNQRIQISALKIPGAIAEMGFTVSNGVQIS